MSAKKLGKIENQPRITTFVGKNTERPKKIGSENTGARKVQKDNIGAAQEEKYNRRCESILNQDNRVKKACKARKQ